MARLEVASETALVALCDPSVTLPSGLDQDALVRALEPLTQSARVFYLVTDDPVRYRIELMAGEPPSADLARDFEASGGAFGLDVPSGTVALYGWSKDGIPSVAGTISTKPGRQVLSVLAPRPFDGAQHMKDMAALLGPEWTYVERVNRLGLVGCLPLALVPISVLARKWHWLWVILPLLAIWSLPYMALRKGRRYKEADRRRAEAEHARPDYVFGVTPSDRGDLAGGFLRV
jgi:hypothetical protein